MNFDEVLAYFIGSELGSSANRSDAQFFKRLLEENKDVLDIENSSLSDKLYLYLLFYTDPKQKTIREYIRRTKKLEDLSDNDMIDVFNDLIAHNNSSYKRDRLTTYFLEFKSEIDKRPLVGANLVLAGFDIVAKTQTVIKDDQDYARFVDRRKSFPTKQYIKYLTEDNTQYFEMQNIFAEKRCYDATISLERCRNIELIKKNYHLYLMYCLGYDDVHIDDIIPSENYDKTLINTDALHLLFDKYINTKILTILENDIKHKKFDLTKAKKFISYYKNKLMSNEYDILRERLTPQSKGYRSLSFDWETIRRGGGWFSGSEKTGKIEVRSYWYDSTSNMFYAPKYVYVLLALLYLFKSEISDEIRDVMDILKSSYLYCSSSDEWKQKNKTFYSDILSASVSMNTVYPEYWTSGGTVSDYILKYEFNEPFTQDGKYVIKDRNNTLHADRQHVPVKEIIDGIETLLNAIGNN